MSATNSTETALLALIFNGTTFDNIAENDSTTPAATFYISLHTGNPGEGGSQTSSEAAYTGYARQAVTRGSGGWTVSGDAAVNTLELTFGECTDDPGGDITHVGLGLSSNGSGTLMLYNPIAAPVEMVEGVIPAFRAGELRFTCQ